MIKEKERWPFLVARPGPTTRAFEGHSDLTTRDKILRNHGLVVQSTSHCEADPPSVGRAISGAQSVPPTWGVVPQVRALWLHGTVTSNVQAAG